MNIESAGVLNYHERTKHQLNAYAKGPGSLDWDDQPQPFRRFTGCEIVTLPKPGTELAVLFADLDTPAVINPLTVNLTSIGLLLELGFGLSAWKQFGPDRWSLRCNPSSGNLHPTEVYLVCTDADLLAPGVYHYVSYDHYLEQRSRFAGPELGAAVYIGLSSLHWREAWKYGERAFRYCQHDTGHALAALSYAAACLGWSVELCSAASDADIAALLGIDRDADFVKDEREYPDLICKLHYGPLPDTTSDIAGLNQVLTQTKWFGKAPALSGRHFYRWPIIDEVTAQAEKPVTAPERWQTELKALPTTRLSLPASELIRQRRSAQHFNGKAEALPLADFQRILAALQANAKPPFSTWNWQPQVDIMLFVHRVDGLEPGLYWLPRSATSLTDFKAAMSADFVWQAIEAPYPFYLLTGGNVRQAAKTLSCHQPIASDSAFSLGMLARFAENVDSAAWHYRRLFWECGLLGQILYLEAEAAGVRGTGIGCFFDDAVHGVLGLQNNTWQSLYHFTVGTPLDDGRLQSFPAYGHLG